MRIIFILLLFLAAHVLHAQTEDDLRLEIYQIKVTEGHATLLVVRTTFPTNTVLSATLIDGGKSRSDDANLIAEVIRDNANSQLDYVFITHYDTDHYNGLIGNSGTPGIIRRRCDPGVAAAQRLTGSAAIPGTRLQVYRGAIASSGRTAVTNELNRYPANLVDNQWVAGTVFNLSPGNSNINNKVTLRSLAIDGNLVGYGTQLAVNNKNSQSGVLLLRWGDFTLLMQGDLQGGGGSKQKIGRTTEYYRPDGSTAKEPRRIPATWSGSAGQNANDFVPATSWNTTIANQGILRVVNDDVTKDNIPLPRVPMVLSEYPYDIAYPNRWHHELGNKINAYNGAAGYAETCMALLPHHGAPTSNLWFDAKYVIVGSNSTNNHGHPVPQAIAAAYHSSGARRFFFTYLQNARSRGVDYDRLTELTQWKNDIGPTVNLHSLNATEKYLRFAVDNNEFGVKEVNVTGNVSPTQSRSIVSLSCDF